MRFKLFLLIVAGALAYFGWREYTLSMSAKSEPTEVTAADIEAGRIPDNCHLVIKDAIALYPASVYHYKKSKYSSAEPGPDTKTSDVLYPVVSMNHPFSKALDSGASSEAALKEALSSVSIIVKSDRFKTIGSIPAKIDSIKSLQGLVLNKVEKIGSKEADLLRSSFPKLDTSTVVLVEEGRKPRPLALGMGMMAGGRLLFAGTIFVALRRR